MALNTRTLYDLGPIGRLTPDPRIQEALAVRQATRVIPPAFGGGGGGGGGGGRGAEGLREALERGRLRESGEMARINAALREREITMADQRAREDRAARTQIARQNFAKDLREAMDRIDYRNSEQDYRRQRDAQERNDRLTRNREQDDLRRELSEGRNQAKPPKPLTPKEVAEVSASTDAAFAELDTALGENPNMPTGDALEKILRAASLYKDPEVDRQAAEKALERAQGFDAARTKAAGQASDPVWRGRFDLGAVGKGAWNDLVGGLQEKLGLKRPTGFYEDFGYGYVPNRTDLTDALKQGMPSDELRVRRSIGSVPGLEKLSPEAVRRILALRQALQRTGFNLETLEILDKLQAALDGGA